MGVGIGLGLSEAPSGNLENQHLAGPETSPSSPTGIPATTTIVHGRTAVAGCTPGRLLGRVVFKCEQIGTQVLGLLCHRSSCGIYDSRHAIAAPDSARDDHLGVASA
jgi:hypothetical protein